MKFFLNKNKLYQKTFINNIIFYKYLFFMSIGYFLKSLDSIGYFLNIFMSFLDNIIRINIFYIFFKHVIYNN